MLIAVLLVGVVLSQPLCPQSVANELQLVAQPLQCFRKVYDYRIHDGHRILKVVNERLQLYKRLLQQVTMSKEQHLQTTPVVKWAQNMGQIFVSYKLSHRQDSPTCSDIRSETLRTEEVNETVGDIPFESESNESAVASTFVYRGECFFTTQKLLFRLTMHFQGKLSKLVLRRSGLGQYTLIGDKSQPNIWVQPFSDFKTAAIWPEMREKHSGDMDKYFEMAESLVDSGKAKKRTRRRPKKSGEGQQL